MSAPQDIAQTIPPDVSAFITQELTSGKSRAAIVDQLVASGWDADQARSVVAKAPIPRSALLGIASPESPAPQASTYGPNRASKRDRHAQGLHRITIGFLWCFGGLAVSGITYYMATVNGGVYVVAWGSILWGAFDMLRGLYLYLTDGPKIRLP